MGWLSFAALYIIIGLLTSFFTSFLQHRKETIILAGVVWPVFWADTIINVVKIIFGGKP